MQTSEQYQSPIGRLDIRLEDGYIVSLDIKRQSSSQRQAMSHSNSAVQTQLDAYFSGKQKALKLPLSLNGTPFQKRVWREMQKIPPGKTLSYGDIAKRLGTDPRAVGNACRANPIPVIVPCHRVVAKAGLGGYAGQTCGRQLTIKKWLLHHEGASLVKATK